MTRRRIRNLGANLALLLLSTALGLFILEGACRILSPMPLFGPYFDLRPYKKLHLKPNLKGVTSPAWHTANKWGLRGEDPPQDWEAWQTIITIGGSTTQCYYLDDEKTWPHLLQEELRRQDSHVWVGNAGLDGHSTLGHRLMMDRIMRRLKPDMVVLLVGANDLWSAVAGNKYDQRFLARLDERSPGRWLHEHSRLLQILNLWKRVIFEDVTVVDQIGHGSALPQPLNPGVKELPREMEMRAFRAFRENVREVIQIARECEIRLLFLTQPSLLADDEYWAGISTGEYWIRGGKYQISGASKARILARLNRLLLEICRENQVECFDLAARVPQSAKYFYDSFHFTERGARRTATEVAAYLMR